MNSIPIPSLPGHGPAEGVAVVDEFELKRLAVAAAKRVGRGCADIGDAVLEFSRPEGAGDCQGGVVAGVSQLSQQAEAVVMSISFR